MTRFELNPRLAGDSSPVTTLGLCQMRLINDSRWPWLLLVPQRPDITEIFELTPLDQALLTFEMTLAARALKQATGCTKVNVGALGNQVRQLHMHVIARFKGDPGWPGPVWGYGTSEPYDDAPQKALIEAILGAL